VSIRVLKHGKPISRLQGGKCQHCGCEVRCLQSDATWLQDGPGDTTACFGIGCPDCERWIYLKPVKENP